MKSSSPNLAGPGIGAPLIMFLCAGLSAQVPAPGVIPNAKDLEAPVSAMGATSSAGASTMPSPVYNQPVVLNSFESVENERLRIAEELVKAGKEEAELEKSILMLQKKLASASLSAVQVDSINTEYRTFLSIDQSDISAADKYYALLKQTLNLLTPDSPYSAPDGKLASDPRKAFDMLQELEKYDQDDGISRAIRAHVSEFFGGRSMDANRIGRINRSLMDLTQKKKSLEWNYKMTHNVNGLSGRQNGSDADRKAIQSEIDEVVRQLEQLRAEKDGLSHRVKEPMRKLQFQQFIVQLALQRRYIHSLIACGFYRGSASRGDMTLEQNAYPDPKADAGKQPAAGDLFADASPGLKPLAQKANPAGLPMAEIPVFSSVTALESFLITIVRDGIRERGALDNMLKEQQFGAAEAQLRSMVVIRKYQPELNTLPYSSRQTILKYGTRLKSLADALNSRNYPEIKQLARELQTESSDASFSDLQQFADEHPRRALHIAKQAELALHIGDVKTASTLMESAVKRAPSDNDVKKKIDDLQESVVTNKKLTDDLDRVVEVGDYKTAYDRMNEFLPVAVTSASDKTRKKFETLIEMEKEVRATLEKCDEHERRASWPEMWIALSDLEHGIGEDSRIVNRKSMMTGKCPRFIEAFANAREYSRKGISPVALAWYLTALAEAPGNPDLMEKVNELGKQIIDL